ncbi:hypothetical protein ACFLVE_01305 [Chloroflexota bacterium]
MKKEARGQFTDKELRRAISRALRRVEKMIREEPHAIVISDGDGDNSSSQISGIAAWLFHRRRDNGSQRDTNRN